MIDRFSLHHRDPEAVGIDPYLPYPGFAALFPPGAPLMDLAYHFIGQHTTALMSDGPTLARLHEAVDTWSEQGAPDGASRFCPRSTSAAALSDS